MEVKRAAHDGLSIISSKILQNHLLQALESEKIKHVHKITVTPGSKLGDNFMGIIHRVEADVITCDDQSRTLSPIIKCAPQNKARCEFFCVNLLFKNETNFYERVVPGLQSDTNILIAVPRCLSSICNGTDDAIILEDLQPAGFKMRKRQLGLDIPHIRVVLQELGKLHALSFNLRERDPNKFKEICTYVKDLFFDADRKTAFEPFIQSSFEETVRIILKHYNFDNNNKYAIAITKLADAGYDLIAGIVKGTRKEEEVITHGDCWTNNLQFSYDDNDKPNDARFLDFQLPRVTSPAIDVTYVLFTSMDHETMSLHYDEIIDVYHSSLDKYLTQLGHSTSQLFPRSRLDAEMARCAPYGLAMSGIVVPAVYCPPESAPDLESVKGDTTDAFVQEYAKQMKADTKDAREHLAAVLQHCVDRRYL